MVDALEKKPNIIVVNDERFLSANDLQKIDIPIIGIFNDTDNRYSNNKDVGQITSNKGKYKTIFFETSNFPS